MNKKILITGASGGIGKLLMKHFFNKHISVQGTFLGTAPKPELEKYFTKVDVSNFTNVKNWIDDNAEPLTELTLINCAGIAYNAVAHKSDPDKWQKVIEVNLIGTYNAISAVLPYMRESNYGRIINFSSVTAQKGVPGTSSYAASKSGIWGMTKAIAVENASRNITINNINLGYMDIGMIKMVPADIQEIIKSNIPMKSFGHPREIIKTIQYLIDADYITGTSIDLNGGLY